MITCDESIQEFKIWTSPDSRVMKMSDEEYEKECFRVFQGMARVSDSLRPSHLPRRSEKRGQFRLIVPSAVHFSIGGPAATLGFAELANATFGEGLLWTQENTAFLAEKKLEVLCLGTTVLGVYRPLIYVEEAGKLSAGVEEFEMGWQCFGKLGFLCVSAS